MRGGGRGEELDVGDEGGSGWSMNSMGSLGRCYDCLFAYYEATCTYDVTVVVLFFCSYPGPVLIIRRMRDEIITTE